MNIPHKPTLFPRMGAMSEREFDEWQETVEEKARSDWEAEQRMRHEEELNAMFGEREPDDEEGDDYEEDELEGF